VSSDTSSAPTSSPVPTPKVPPSPGVTASTASTERVVDPIRGDHYGRMKMQPLEFIIANDLNFLAGNVIKYTTRGALGDSSEQRLLDLAKARHYVELLLECEGRRFDEER
jgi:Protein of unknwon function (DUF3310)